MYPAAFCTESPSLLLFESDKNKNTNTLKATAMSASSAFNDEKGGSSSVGEPEYGHDPASGGIFSSDYKRYELPASVLPATVSVCHIVGRASLWWGRGSLLSANTYIKYAVTSVDNGQHVELSLLLQARD